MKSQNLLIVTQKMDKNDPILGFFHGWVEEFSKNVEKLNVICLEKGSPREMSQGDNFAEGEIISQGSYNLPKNVQVFSLGKEQNKSKLKYIWNFYKYIFKLRKEYDAVFVHMNQEYVLLAGIFWKILGKKVMLWRNHQNGSWLTNIAVDMSDVVFCTSPSSYTFKFKKTKLMPTGINVEKFMLENEPTRVSGSILSMGRISSVKKIDVLVRALLHLDSKGFEFKVDIVGDRDPKEPQYYDLVKELAELLVKKGKIQFKDSVPNTKTPQEYFSHELFINLTSSGSLDKTIFSAMISGDLVLVCNTFFIGVLPEQFIFKDGDVYDLSSKIKAILEMDNFKKRKVIEEMKKYVMEKHSVSVTIKMIMNTI
ncbi:MAG: hypothetical protein Athens071416_169 [Parcubacteria group bacterium Athens0714_16]|nr:MAG: hypothetical protein Athens071416_169 [Parcubacteria group bacterium Athens0714_16]